MSLPFHEIESLYRRAIAEIHVESELCPYVLRVYYDLVLKISDAADLQFNTLFARVSYIASRFQLTKAWAFAFQIPRREIRQRVLSDDRLLPIAMACIEYLLLLAKAVAENKILVDPVRPPHLPDLPFTRPSGRFKKAFARVVITEWSTEEKIIRGLDEEETGKMIDVHYSVPGVNDIFSETLELALDEMGLPLTLGLVDVDHVADHEYIPGYIILLPDLLLDVTSVADYTAQGSDPLAVNLIGQYLPAKSNLPLLIGKIANFFLDELIRDTTLDFTTLFTHSFKLFPLEFIGLTDTEVKGLMKQLNLHYNTIRTVIEEKFPTLGIEKANCVIEPSYFSAQYGIKGRLDLYYQHEKEKTASIIELKSGRPFKPNSYGLSSSNYHQTLLYELLIKSVHGPSHYRANFILYSAMSDNPLRYAVSLESIQKEAIHNRNQLVLLQFRMIHLDQPGSRDVLAEIDPARYEHLKGFIKTDSIEFHTAYSGLSANEKKYIKAFSAFIAREHMLARIGNVSDEGAGGLAGLWLDSATAKEEKYQLLRGLQLLEIQRGEQQTILVFAKGKLTNPLANFRAGDIAIVYPYDEKEEANPTRYQLHRASVLLIDAQQVIIRLRNHQVNTRQIESVARWNIEHDLLDSSFRSLYQSLWVLMRADVDARKMILGVIRPPAYITDHQRDTPQNLTKTQQGIYHEALDAGFLYLLWGPPGTGKTSIMLKQWVAHYFYATQSRILLLAYTNKAVDEICTALEELPGPIADEYLRIGSRAAVHESFRPRMLDEVIGPMSRRSEIKDLLETNRLIVGTVASIQGKAELFELVNFDVLIMDEASQVLEPAIAGLLTKTKKAILIGDHMQLSAVSVQSRETTVLKDESKWAESFGITDLGMSYFERIYRLYQNQQANHLIGTLHEQGRMHQDIMAYANRFVYQGVLTCIHPDRQSQSFSDLFPDEDHPVLKSRLTYIPSFASLKEAFTKTNLREAKIVLDVLIYWQGLITRHGLEWTIGVITPFRAQIAAITHLAHAQGVDLSAVTVDTVERYQGGARDIIIMSCAVNHSRALDRITSLSQEGIDRKLNVAVTRARQQFVLVGVEDVLNLATAYRQLIQSSDKIILEPQAEAVE